MKKTLIVTLAFLTAGCSSTVGNMWDGIITAFRSIGGNSREVNGYGIESRLVSSTSAFFGESNGDFIPLNDQDIKSQFLDYTVPQPKEVPGDPGGKVPGIDAFTSPSGALANLFTKIYFNTDEHVPKNKDYFQSLHRMATFLKKHPNTYIFIEGHTDERASESYNLSLGTRRCNYIRNFLIKDGVNPEQLFTISFGKERPQDHGHGEKHWAKNRRIAFKIYEKRTSV